MDVLEPDAYFAFLFFYNVVIMCYIYHCGAQLIASVTTDAGSATADSVGSVHNSYI